MTPEIPGLPELHWTSTLGESRYDRTKGELTLTAAAGVDWSNPALGGAQEHGATALVFPATENVVLSARVSVDGPRSLFDAAALVLWADESHWAKLCFEQSPNEGPMIVSVVTNKYSDDCNSEATPSDWVYLRISRVGDGWAFHASVDGHSWAFIRQFRLYTQKPVQIGFLAQAPMGESCVAHFDNIVYSQTPPKNMRDWS